MLSDYDITELGKLYPTIEGIREVYTISRSKSLIPDGTLIEKIMEAIPYFTLEEYMNPANSFTVIVSRGSIELSKWIASLDYLQFNFNTVKDIIHTDVYKALDTASEYELINKCKGYRYFSRRYQQYAFENMNIDDIFKDNQEYKATTESRMGLFYDPFFVETIVEPLNPHFFEEPYVIPHGDTGTPTKVRIIGSADEMIYPEGEFKMEFEPIRPSGGQFPGCYPYIIDPLTGEYIRSWLYPSFVNKYSPRYNGVGDNFYTTKEFFEAKFSNYTGGLFTDFNWSNVVISGGFLLELVKKRTVLSVLAGSDLDMFIYGSDDDIYSKIRYIIDYLQKYSTINYFIINANVIDLVIEINHVGKDIPIILHLQMIACGHALTPFEIFTNYDLDYNLVGYDGTNVFAAIDSYFSHKYMITKTLKSNMKKNRLVKAFRKGYITMFMDRVYLAGEEDVEQLKTVRTIKAIKVYPPKGMEERSWRDYVLKPVTFTVETFNRELDKSFRVTYDKYLNDVRGSIPLTPNPKIMSKIKRGDDIPTPSGYNSDDKFLIDYGDIHIILNFTDDELMEMKSIPLRKEFMSNGIRYLSAHPTVERHLTVADKNVLVLLKELSEKITFRGRIQNQIDIEKLREVLKLSIIEMIGFRRRHVNDAREGPPSNIWMVPTIKIINREGALYVIDDSQAYSYSSKYDAGADAVYGRDILEGLYHMDHPGGASMIRYDVEDSEYSNTVNEYARSEEVPQFLQASLYDRMLYRDPSSFDENLLLDVGFLSDLKDHSDLKYLFDIRSILV
jgi:hypothetical protein